MSGRGFAQPKAAGSVSAVRITVGPPREGLLPRRMSSLNCDGRRF